MRGPDLWTSWLWRSWEWQLMCGAFAEWSVCCDKIARAVITAFFDTGS